MKKFILKVLLFGICLVLLYGIGFVMPATPRASKSLLYAKVHKDELLRNTDGPRIIFVGGSNLSFGINSNLIKDSLKLNPINTAIHASIGLQHMMDNTLQYVRKNDIIILAPEYSQFYGRYVYGGEELLRSVADVEFLDMFKLSVEQFKNISEYIIKYSYSKLKSSEYSGFKESDVYSVNSFNQYGDVDAHWNMEQRSFAPYGAINKDYNPNTIELINDFRVELNKKEANLLVTYPGYQASSFDRSINQIKRVEKELLNNNFEILGTPKRYRIPDSLMFNTPYHLLKKGVDYRTKLLIEDIKQSQAYTDLHKNE